MMTRRLLAIEIASCKRELRALLRSIPESARTDVMAYVRQSVIEPYMHFLLKNVPADISLAIQTGAEFNEEGAEPQRIRGRLEEKLADANTLVLSACIAGCDCVLLRATHYPQEKVVVVQVSCNGPDDEVFHYDVREDASARTVSLDSLVHRFEDMSRCNMYYFVPSGGDFPSIGRFGVKLARSERVNGHYSSGMADVLQLVKGASSVSRVTYGGKFNWRKIDDLNES